MGGLSESPSPRLHHSQYQLQVMYVLTFVYQCQVQVLFSPVTVNIFVFVGLTEEATSGGSFSVGEHHLAGLNMGYLPWTGNFFEGGNFRYQVCLVLGNYTDCWLENYEY